MKIPSDIVLHKKSRTLELSYSDGTAYVFPFEFLRVYSPSADVAGHTPDQAVLQHGKRNVELTGIEPMGTYALKLVFSDKHDSGLYTWDYFDEIGRNQESMWASYLEKLAAAGLNRDE